MDNSDKRFVLYCWYATNVYSIRCKNKRAVLPLCFLLEIRALYPNAEDVPYTGHVQNAYALQVVGAGNAPDQKRHRQQHT